VGKKVNDIKRIKNFPSSKFEYSVNKIKDLSPLERIVIKTYIKTNGCASTTAKRVGISRQRVHRILKKPLVRKKLRRVFEYLGLDLLLVGRTLKKIMKRHGDFHYDYNKLGAINTWAKLVGAFSPKEVLHHETSDREANKTETRKILVEMLRTLRKSDKDEEVKSKSRIPGIVENS